MNGQNNISQLYFIIAFIEGASVMAIEILSAKMIAPFYGTSLYVWSSVIGVTLGGLASGYFLGGFLVDKYTKPSLLFTILIIGSALIGLMNKIGNGIMDATVMSMDVRSGSLVSCLVFLLPPLVCMGMVSPTIIRLAAKDVEHTGRTAGTVYAVSTLGGILMTFLMGFYLIHQWGIRNSTYATALVLGAATIFYGLTTRKKTA